MKRLLHMMLVAVFATLMFSACVLSPGPGGYGVVATPIVPPLPAVVVLGAEPYYYQDGYHYYYQNDRWRYSRSRGGPWTDLPRSHWPKEIRHRGSDERGGEFGREHGGR